MNFSPLSALRGVLYPNGPLADVERAQPVETSAVGSAAPRQISHSTDAPLNAQQLQQLAQPSSMAALETRAVPALAPLQHAAQALAAQANHLPPSEVAKRRMALEGALLLAHPGLDFYSAGDLLDRGQASPLAPRVPEVEVTTFMQHIGGLFSDPQHASLAHDQVCAALDEGLERMARHLEGHEAFFHQALQSPLTDTQRTQINAGHRAFIDTATAWQHSVGQLLETTRTLVDERLEAAQRVLKPLQAQAPKNHEQAQRVAVAEQNVQAWQVLHDHFTQVSDGTNPVDQAAKRVQLDDHVTALNALRKGWFTQLATSMAEGIAQGIASALLFVMARAYVDPRLTVLSLVTQSLANGAAMGAVHEGLDSIVKPAAREALASLGLRESTEVPVDSLIHDASRATVVNGRYHERTDTEMAAEQAVVEQARTKFLNSQNDFKTGTLRGDALTYLNQPLAQMVRQLVSVTSDQNTGSVPARGATSFAGGVGMAFTQALGKLNTTYRHDGRDLPTHVPKAAPEDSLYERLGKVVSKALPTVDPRRSDARESYASKIWSAAEGMLGYNAIGRAMGSLDTATRSGAAGSVALAYIQAVALLLPFYANRQSGSEAKADDTDRVSGAIANVLRPDRPTLAHGTQPDTVMRGVENGYNRIRGLTQVAPQLATMLTEAAVGTTVSLGGALGNTVRRRNNATVAPQPPAPIAANPPRLSLGDLSTPVSLDVALSNVGSHPRVPAQPAAQGTTSDQSSPPGGPSTVAGTAS
ncbi:MULTISPECIES: type III effector HopM1 [Pseudomonas]|uniref:Type III effector HopM1 n=1 Tax=Pseudomonas quercus TaxID=2722792 RepID=A0ABX0YCF6_9PSED|nr:MULTISPECIES: type III effector HopM1 [Pseudomonas]MBF7142527.1 type III effector HopM1 [Pseudomonas sp. LY10J]NJP01065.1 type III effector HopM1 [Pseudomonas quercus]